MATTIVMLLH